MKSSKYAVLGFSHCGTHSLQKYLQRQGHEVYHNDNYWSWDKYIWERMIRFGYKPILITRDEELGRRLHKDTFEKHLERLKEFEPIVVRLEEMRLKKGFPIIWPRTATLQKLGIKDYNKYNIDREAETVAKTI